jgi:putative membrane protein
MSVITGVVLVASSALYAKGVRTLWRQAGRGQGIRWWEVVAFAAAVLSLAVALLSPLATASGRLFSAHMTQHELLMLVAAPLIAMSQAGVAYLWAFRMSARRSIGSGIHSIGWHHLTSPFTAFVLHALALWLWHIPVLYEAAMANQWVHGLQHLSFFATAAIFWWGMVHGRYGRAGYGVAVFYVFLTAMHSSILGALATVADRVWYPTYAQSVQGRPDPLADQQLAGLIMWIPSGVIFILVGLALLAAWLGESERRVRMTHIP